MLAALVLQAQQLKLGNNPTSIERSAVLELESPNQGLLLTKVPDTAAINSIEPASGPPDGMLIYFTDTTGLTPPGLNTGIYQRKEGAWQRIAQFFTDDTIATGPDGIAFTRSHDTITLHLPDASPTVRGVVNGKDQVFAGDKHFRDSLIAEGGFRANNAQIDDSLILSNFKNMHSPAKGWFLSTDANGKVFLQSIEDVFWKLGGNNISSGTSDSLGTVSNTNLPIITNNIERMRITNKGKVGIGTKNPSDTLTVNGSFKLGNGGSSFSAMAHTTFGYSISSTAGYDVPSPIYIKGIKPNAHVIVNPRTPLEDSNKKIAIISWVRASSTDYITICFYTPEANSIGNVTFDVYYINP